MKEYDFTEVQNCYNITAKQYSDSFSNELEGKPFDCDILKKFAGLTDQTKPVYEFVAGSCHITNFLYQNGLKNIIATDITKESLEYASLKYSYIKTAFMNMFDTGLPENSISGIICFYGIVHFTYREIEMALKEWKRILMPGGKALFSFHIGHDESLRAEQFLGCEKAKATWNFFEPETIVEIMKNINIEYSEVIIRYPYHKVEHPSKRCYIQFEKDC